MIKKRESEWEDTRQGDRAQQFYCYQLDADEFKGVYLNALAASDEETVRAAIMATCQKGDDDEAT